MFRCQICFLFLFSSILDGDDLEMFRRVSKVVIVCVCVYILPTMN